VKGFIEEMKPLNARSVPLKEKPDIFFLMSRDKKKSREKQFSSLIGFCAISYK